MADWAETCSQYKERIDPVAAKPEGIGALFKNPVKDAAELVIDEETLARVFAQTLSESARAVFADLIEGKELVFRVSVEDKRT